MLHELRVENLLLIERARLQLAPGLNVITGETGAGKTVLAHALEMLLGGRARPGIVRPGAREAYVEGTFELPASLREQLAERLGGEEVELVLARRVGADGRTRAYVGGRSATVAELRELGTRLLSFYGQHEHRRLTIAAVQLELLDELCGGEHGLRLRACGQAWAEVRGLRGELQALRELAGARDRELELLEHELAEIDAGSVEEEEHTRLLQARERMRRLDSLCAAAGAGAEALSPESAQELGAAALVASAAARVETLTGVDSRLDALGERLRGVAIECAELAAELRSYGEGAAAACAEPLAGHAGPPTLEALEERLALIERLARKHGGSIQAMHDYATRAAARRDQLAGADVALAQADERLGQAEERFAEHVRALRAARRAAAPRLEQGVREQLGALAMGEASFEVVLSEREPGPAGGDAVEFMLATNPGVPAGPVREIASGGELSRVMLALTTACAQAAQPRRGRRASGGAARAPQGAAQSAATLAFDELDAGIGGQTARAVGAQLRELARGRQLLCITHLPQIASLAERHFAIVKDTSLSPARTSVLELGAPQVEAELVRMMGADSSDKAARRHARDLLRAA